MYSKIFLFEMHELSNSNNLTSYEIVSIFVKEKVFYYLNIIIEKTFQIFFHTLSK